LLYLVPLYAQSLRNQEQNPKKIYLVDVGLMQAFTAQPDKDLGRKLENLVFLKKRRWAGELCYVAHGPEIDLVQRGESNLVFTNVCWALDQAETRRRELADLTAARQQFPKARLELIAHEPGRTQFRRRSKSWWPGSTSLTDGANPKPCTLRARCSAQPQPLQTVSIKFTSQEHRERGFYELATLASLPAKP
jgi:hypothetical protein